jgi:hypothetical protein
MNIFFKNGNLLAALTECRDSNPAPSLRHNWFATNVGNDLEKMLPEAEAPTEMIGPLRRSASRVSTSSQCAGRLWAQKALEFAPSSSISASSVVK